MRPPWLATVAWRFSVSVVLLVGLGWWLDGRAVIAQVEQINLRWVAFGLFCRLVKLYCQHGGGVIPLAASDCGYRLLKQFGNTTLRCL